MPAVRLTRFLELGRRVIVLGVLLPLLAVAQMVSANQVLSVAVRELHAVSFDPLLRSSEIERDAQTTSGLRWTTNSGPKKLTVEAVPPVAGLRLVVRSEHFGSPIQTDLGSAERQMFDLPIHFAAGRGWLEYEVPRHSHGDHGECLVRFTITNF